MNLGGMLPCRGVLLSALWFAPIVWGQDRAPVVPGLHGDQTLGQRQQGEVLLEELRCLACHSRTPEDAGPVLAGPDLKEVGWRVSPNHLRRFIADPGGVHPGTKMPSLLAAEPPSRRAEIANAITAFLVERADRPFLSETPDPKQVERGRVLYHRVGCVACHEPRDPPYEGGRTPAPLPGAVTLEHVATKYSRASLASFLFRPAAVRPAGRMPDMGLDRGEADAIGAYLVADAAAELEWPAMVPGQVAAGRRWFEEFRCGACHALEGVSEPQPVGTDGLLDPERGCLAPDPGGAPRFGLDPSQRAALALALASPAPQPTDSERIDATLAAFHCLACHVRDDRGGVSPQLDPYFETDEHDLGNEARIPPDLTLAGAKLRQEWMRKVLFDGASVRPYMHTRMPQFGETHLTHLPDLFAGVDVIEPFEILEFEGEEEREARDAARDLLGNKALSCISCHDFNGKETPGFGGIDLITSVERLHPSWFARFVIAPQVYRPGILMPESWAGGVASMAEVLGGDTRRQISAIWHYLSLGRSAGDPPGIRSVGSRLEVNDRARTYRGRSGLAGFRGIAVGLPGGLNYAFDAQTGTLAGLWRGDFVSVRWDGQGAGGFNPGARAISLARDVSFHRPATAEEPWPLRPRTDKEHPVDPEPLYPRNRGYRFRGYSLDEAEVPTFRYESGDVAVEDRGEANFSDDRVVLERALRLTSPVAEALTFRALTGQIDALGPRRFAVPGLVLTVPEVPSTLRPIADAEGDLELLLQLDLPVGSTVLRIDYELTR